MLRLGMKAHKQDDHTLSWNHGEFLQAKDRAEQEVILPRLSVLLAGRCSHRVGKVMLSAVKQMTPRLIDPMISHRACNWDHLRWVTMILG